LLRESIRAICLPFLRSHVPLSLSGSPNARNAHPPIRATFDWKSLASAQDQPPPFSHQDAVCSEGFSCGDSLLLCPSETPSRVEPASRPSLWVRFVTRSRSASEWNYHPLSLFPFGDFLDDARRRLPFPPQGPRTRALFLLVLPLCPSPSPPP